MGVLAFEFAGGHVLGERPRERERERERETCQPESIQIPWSDWLFHESYCFVAIAPHNADVLSANEIHVVYW